MFGCQWCLRRALRALLSEPPMRLSLASTNIHRSSRGVVRRFSGHTRLARPAAVPSIVDASTAGAHSAAISLTRGNGVHLSNQLEHEGKANRCPFLQIIRRPDEQQERDALASARREAPWFKDPYRLAESVRERLHQEASPLRFLKILTLVRLLSKKMSCVVSWNHIVLYLLKQKAPEAAIRIYNEMKKRAQFPDSRTYTIMLSGLARNLDAELAKSYALKIYHSMFHNTSRVKPTAFHTNAALNVCAMAGDMDAVWGIISRLPEEGANAPDATTYATVLKALRLDMQHRGTRPLSPANSAGEEDGEDYQYSEATIAQGRQIWLDIIKRWQRAQVNIDENLMCSMGELLLTSSAEHNIDDIFSLVEQVAQIPRQVPRPSKDALPALKGPDELADLPHEATGDTEHSEVNERPEIDPFDAKLALSEVRGKKPRSAARKANDTRFVQPSHNTLSLLLKACLKAHLQAPVKGHHMRAARNYWALLVDSPEGLNGHKIAPDKENYYEYLRVLRASRNSNAALQILRTMDARAKSLFAPHGKLPAKAFRIALPSCTRNEQSPNAMAEACEMYRLLLRHTFAPDLKAMHHVLDLAQSHPDTAAAVTALRLVLTGSSVDFGDWNVRRHENDVALLVEENNDPAVLEGALLLARKIVSAADRLAKSEEILRTERDGLSAAKAAMSYLVQKHAGADPGAGESIAPGVRQRGHRGQRRTTELSATM